MKQKSSRMTYFFVVMFIFNMAANFVHPVTPTIIMDLALNDYMFGLAFATMMAFNFLFSPFWGKIAGQISSKTVMLIGGLGYALGQVLFGLAQTETQFLLARLVAGTFCGGSYVTFLTYTVNMSSEEKRRAQPDHQCNAHLRIQRLRIFCGRLDRRNQCILCSVDRRNPDSAVFFAFGIRKFRFCPNFPNIKVF